MSERFFFRGKIKESQGADWKEGDWITGNLVQGQETFISPGKTLCMVVVHEEAIGQCTGLRDKNGTLIFEGDIVFCGWGEKYQGIYEHSNRYTVSMEDFGALHAISVSNAVEIIGNIHDTPNPESSGDTP